MSEAYKSIEFWSPSAGEDRESWRNRILDDGLLFSLPGSMEDPRFGKPAEEENPGAKALNDFLNHADPDVRAIAVRAWACANLTEATDETVPRIISMIDDRSPEVRLEAIRCCRQENLRDAVPALLRRLREDETVRRDLQGVAPPRRSPMAREMFQALEAFDVEEAIPLLVSLGVPSRWLSRRHSPPLSYVGCYVPAAEGQTRLLPSQKLSENPDCPECRERVRIIAIVQEPFGPPGAGPLSFYRCLRCTTHTPLFVALGPPARRVGETFAEDQDGPGFRGPEPGGLPWSLAWRARVASEELGVYTPLLGGEPNWVQNDETPVCPPCGERMDFVVSLPGTAEEFPLVEYEGVVFGFWCRGCRVTATHFQVS